MHSLFWGSGRALPWRCPGFLRGTAAWSFLNNKNGVLCCMSQRGEAPWGLSWQSCLNSCPDENPAGLSKKLQRWGLQCLSTAPEQMFSKCEVLQGFLFFLNHLGERLRSPLASQGTPGYNGSVPLQVLVPGVRGSHAGRVLSGAVGQGMVTVP